ncbi:hypothetical protein VTN31DRAFT_7062 [Thermomyces dupontii]|uniref:uncharacterized protein n=1 Tax=Talaromyces thermophilus TaxID=28565 RepID=UPI003742C53D
MPSSVASGQSSDQFSPARSNCDNKTLVPHSPSREQFEEEARSDHSWETRSVASENAYDNTSQQGDWNAASGSNQELSNPEFYEENYGDETSQCFNQGYPGSEDDPEAPSHRKPSKVKERNGSSNSKNSRLQSSPKQGKKGEPEIVEVRRRSKSLPFPWKTLLNKRTGDEMDVNMITGKRVIRKKGKPPG